ncbi:MAG: hypothetical protein QOI82_3577 [Actinomycetota bacterium]|nr:hypothetical protein [Actinomycetota bacterium]
MRGLTLDAGALIELERRSATVVALLDRGSARRLPVRIPATVLAQVWRGGARQPRLGRLIRAEGTEIVTFDEETAKAVGELLAFSRTDDVVDASVVMCARLHGDRIVTSDVDDLRRLDAGVELVAL